MPEASSERAGEHVTIDNCSNRDVGDVSSVGTYVGGLCEVSEGTIVNCSVSSIGSGTADYVGGIAGSTKQAVKLQTVPSRTGR